MVKSSEIRTGRHCVFMMHAHLVFVTKYRKKVFTNETYYPPKVSVSKLVNSLKGVSSRLLRKEYPSMDRNYYKGALWSPSYFAGSCGGAPLDVIKQYVEQQKRPYKAH